MQERYLDQQRLPGLSWSVLHRGELVHRASLGYEDDAIFRVYSMTKPITSVAMLMLIERGLCRLADPVARFLPDWSDLRVYDGGSPMAVRTTAARRPMTIQDLFTHTSGLTYGWMWTHPIDAMYRDAEIGDRSISLTEMCSRLTEIPLLFSPGDGWQYSVATDVLGHLVELISDTALDVFLAEQILEPLGMEDTAFHVDDGKAHRLVDNHALGAISPFGVPENARPAGIGDLLVIDDNASSGEFRTPPALLSGGGGLTSTVSDYNRFCQMILDGGELDGTRLLGSRTLRFAGLNHLPGGADIHTLGGSLASLPQDQGIGFGLGFSVVLDPARSQVIASPGTLAWGGAASTLFWVDPAEDLAVIAMTQLMPSSAYPIRQELRQLVYAAL